MPTSSPWIQQIQDFRPLPTCECKTSVADRNFATPRELRTIDVLIYSLLDPSCSGSGIVNRLDHLLETGTRLFLTCKRTATDFGCLRGRKHHTPRRAPYQACILSVDD